MNSNLVKRQNKTGGTVAEGECVLQDSASDDGIVQTSTNYHIAIYGVVVDGDFSTDGWLTIAVAGDYNILCNGTVTRNQLVVSSATTGESFTLSTGATGSYAITKQARSGGGSSLVKAWIHKMDTF